MVDITDFEVVENLKENGDKLFKEYAERIYGKGLDYSLDSFGEYSNDEVRYFYNGWASCFDWLINSLNEDSSND